MIASVIETTAHFGLFSKLEVTALTDSRVNGFSI
jgi:hypothetical protein